MLLSASIRRPLRLLRLFDCGGDDVRVAAEPLGLLDELASLDLVDLNEPAAFMVRRGNLEGRHQTTETEIIDRLKHLWENRLARAKASSSPEQYMDELASFSWYFIAAKFDDEWAIDQLTEPIKVEGLEPKGQIRGFKPAGENNRGSFRSPLFR